MAWNPVATSDVQTFELECARPHLEPGDAQPTASFRPWSAGERLAYEDRCVTEVATKDRDGGSTARMGTLRALHLSLTLVTVDGAGWPATVSVERPHHDPELRATGTLETVAERFDTRNVKHLETLTSEVFEELYRHAESVQPIPTRGDGGKAEAGEGDVDPDADPPIDPPAADA